MGVQQESETFGYLVRESDGIGISVREAGIGDEIDDLQPCDTD